MLKDDVIAIGAIMRAAISAFKKQRPALLVVAVPVTPRSTVRELEAVVDEVVCVRVAEPIGAIGTWYEDFRHVSDEKGFRIDQAGGHKGVASQP